MVARIQKTLDHLGELSYPAILLLYAANTVVFAFAYAVIETIAGSSLISSVTNTPVTNFFDLLYFSVITATSTGYGDIVPVAYARPFAAVESFLGLMLLAVLVSKLISKKQDAALSGVHQIAFQSAIHEVREDLYIARKDLDRAIQWLDRDSEALTPSEWERITIACDHTDHLLEEIPEFYDMIINQNYDLVSGWKKKRYDNTFTKNIPSKICPTLPPWLLNGASVSATNSSNASTASKAGAPATV